MPSFDPPAHTPFQWTNSPATPLDANHLLAAETDIVNYAQDAIQALDAARTLNPTATHTSNYALSPQDLAAGDAQAQSLTFTLPTAPTDGTAVGIGLVATSAGNGLTYQTGGGDVLYLPGGPTSDTLNVAQQSVQLQYAAGNHTWYLRSASKLATAPHLAFIAQPQSPWNAAPNQYIVADTSSGQTQVNLPASPPEGTQVGGLLQTAGADSTGKPFPLTFVAGGSDSLATSTGVALGNPTYDVTTPGQPTIFQYANGLNTWVPISGAGIEPPTASTLLTPTTPISVQSVTVAGVAGQTLSETERGFKIGAGAPTTGTWNVGDRIDAVAAGSVVPHICTTGGTPGLWDGATGTAPVVTYPLAANSVTQTTATLLGSINPSSQVTTYHFEYGTTNSYGTIAPVLEPTLPGSDTAVYPVTMPITGLTAGTTYHYRLVATNSTGTTNGSDQTFTTVSSAPTPIITYPGTPTTSINNTSAVLNGLVNPHGLATSYVFDWGTTTGYGNQLPSAAGISKVQIGTINSQATTSLILTLPNTPTANSNNVLIAFITTPGDTAVVTPPTGWTLIGSQAMPGGSSPLGQINAFYHAVQSGDGTSYTFTRPTSVAIAGCLWEYTGCDLVKLVDTFAGSNGTGTTVTSASVTPTNTNAEVLVGFVHSGADANWGAAPTNSYLVETGATNSKCEYLSLGMNSTTATSTSDTLAASHPWASLAIVLEGNTGVASAGNGVNPVAEAVAVTGLTAGTTYHWRLSGTNANGTTHGADQTFSTTSSTTPPTIVVNAPTAASQTGITLNGTVNANGIGSTTYQWVYGGPSGSYLFASPASPGSVVGSSPVSVPAVLTGLSPGTQYNYALQATNAGGTYRSANSSFTTTQSTSTTIFVRDPASGVLPGYQGCNTANGDNWNSLAVLQAGNPANPTGRAAYAISISDGTTGPQINASCKTEFNTAGRQATEVQNFAPGFGPGAHVWLSCSYFVPTHFPLPIPSFYGLNELFGSPYNGPPLGVGIFAPGGLLVTGGTKWNTPNLFPYTLTYANLGTVTLGVWHDFLFEMQFNTISQGNAVGKVTGGLTSQNIPNPDGWFRCWHSANNNSTFTQGSQVTLSQGTAGAPPPGVTGDPNFPTGAPAGAPSGAVGVMLAQPGSDWPMTGNGSIGWWTFGYTHTDLLALNGGTVTTYAGAVKCGSQQSDVT